MSVSKLVEKIDADVFLESLSKLDPALKDILSSSIGGDLIEKTIVKYGVDLYHLPDLMMLFGLYVTKLIIPQEFINYLAVFVPQKYFPQFLQELEDKLWSPYDVYLNKAGVVYKQLTKLTPQPIQQTTDNLQQTTGQKPEAIPPGPTPAATLTQSPAVSQTIPMPPEVPQPSAISIPAVPAPPLAQPITVSKPVAAQGSGMARPVVIFDVSPAGEKWSVEVPAPPVYGESSGEAKQARVKFDAPRVGPRIFKPTESAITPKASEVKFVGPEIKPEVSGNVPPASSQWQRPEEKKVEIPKPPEVKKTEIGGRQVIDLTNFGLSQSDKD